MISHTINNAKVQKLHDSLHPIHRSLFAPIIFLTDGAMSNSSDEFEDAPELQSREEAVKNDPVSGSSETPHTEVENPILDKTEVLTEAEPEPVDSNEVEAAIGEDPTEEPVTAVIGEEINANPPETLQEPFVPKPSVETEEVSSPENNTIPEVSSPENSAIPGVAPPEAKSSGSGVSPPLPSRKPIKDCLRLDQPNAILTTSSANEESLRKLDIVSNSYHTASANFLLESKYNELNRGFELKDAKAREQISSGSETIRKTFNDIKNTVGGLSNDFTDYKIDWELWTRIVNDYESVLRNESSELNDAIMTGIPKEFRGIVWQLISKSKNFHLEEFYYSLKAETSVHEKSIRRDLSRTSFFTAIEKSNKTDELFNVIKAYSLFDPDVGYTQGMVFIVVPLIMNMNESECFCMLVTLMKDYKLRDLFSPEMKGLHLLLYEFDRLLEMYSPGLYNHLVKQGIKSSMYASQWFLTFFAYKFPLDIVLRIYDIIITQGIESILKFSVNLMIKNEANLSQLKFDKLLDFLKNNLFNVYVNDEFIVNGSPDSDASKRASMSSSSVSRRFSLLGGSGGSAANKKKDYYKLDQLVRDSMDVNVVPVDLNKFEIEFENIFINEKSKLEEIETLKIENGKLRHDIKLLETEYSNLNRDHVDIMQKMVDIKVTLPEVLNDNDELNSNIEQLANDIQELQSKVSANASSPQSGNTSSSSILKSPNPNLPSSIESNIQQLLETNAQETERFAELDDEYNALVDEDSRLAGELSAKGNKKWFKWK